MRSFIYILITTFFLISCKDDDDTQPPEIKVDDLGIVTGLVLTDDNGQGIGSVGNPNWYNGLILYPNPPSDFQSAILQSGEFITELHLVPAAMNKEFSEAEVTAAFNNFLGYTSSELQSQSARSSTIFSNTPQIRYRFAGLAPGYYRVIATDANGGQHGSTIFIDSTLAYPTELRDFLFSDWQ